MVEACAEIGLDKAQITGPDVPLDDTLVKNPGSCPPPIEGELLIRVSDGRGVTASFHSPATRPPLVTTRPSPSLGS